MKQHLSHQSQQSCFQAMSPWGDCQCCGWLAGHRQRAHRVISVQTRFTTDTSTRVPLRYILFWRPHVPRWRLFEGEILQHASTLLPQMCALIGWPFGGQGPLGNERDQRPSQHVHQITRHLLQMDFVLRISWHIIWRTKVSIQSHCP